MRIAMIAAGHTSSGIPLAKAFLDAGHKVDFYLLREHRPSIQDAIEFHYDSYLFGVRRTKYNQCPELFDYINNPDFTLYGVAIASIISRVPLLRKLHRRGKEYVRFAKMVDKQEYDFINIIGRYTHSEFIFLLEHIRTKVAVTLHEVCEHNNPNYDTPTPLLEYLFEKKIRIIVHSKNTLESIQNYRGCDLSMVNVIPFGSLDTFKYLASDNYSLPEKYLLFIGFITPYKGLNILYEAVNGVNIRDYKVVVAGSGYVPTIDRIKADDRYVLLEGYISNTLFATLMNKCSFVVCPYLSMSQSGIPQSAFAFNKPIIASDLKGFKEVITNDINGLLFPNGDEKALASVIQMLIDNNSIQTRISDNIAEFKVHSNEFSWENIQKKYLIE